MSKSIEPLNPALWFQRIAIIADGQLGNLENSLRHAGHLIQLAPISFQKILTPILDEDDFEALLDAGQLDTAARRLFGPEASLVIEPGAAGEPARAVFACAMLRRQVDGHGDSPGAATLNAWARWLIALRIELGLDLEGGSGPAGEGA